jgi:hypothetical protein
MNLIQLLEKIISELKVMNFEDLIRDFEDLPQIQIEINRIREFVLKKNSKDIFYHRIFWCYRENVKSANTYSGEISGGYVHRGMHF